jgi:hypothetical protein
LASRRVSVFRTFGITFRRNPDQLCSSIRELVARGSFAWVAYSDKGMDSIYITLLARFSSL